ncbi:sigma-70 family RNA polymerase sigma factor [Halobacillus sp. A5]|uniref:sigma-70 family RNA polymerase sigma factor n=1 Tax=Halobacillus sp. A5 TaxID=2880263 RepID=UPI0020A65CD0|nr:sigma-70 family RNA polymerase sigma factor [Halobacillus sp. A5]MCP3029161.1 sigma-70 family RNA polymerase sigma factor [Halobacillus sp. A5]
MRKEFEKQQAMAQKNTSVFAAAINKPSTKNCRYVNPLYDPEQIEARFVNYVTTALWRQAKDYHKKRYSHQQSINVEDIEMISADEDVIQHLTERDLFESLENKELYRAVKKLTDRQQYVLYTYAVERFTFQEIADQLEVSQQSVSKTYRRMMTKLRLTLKGDEQIWD